jgi:hypothetical protein
LQSSGQAVKLKFKEHKMTEESGGSPPDDGRMPEQLSLYLDASHLNLTRVVDPREVATELLRLAGKEVKEKTEAAATARPSGSSPR